MIEKVRILLIGLIIGLTIGAVVSSEISYKQGQIDCLNGAVKYELVKQPDNSMTWEEKK